MSTRPYISPMSHSDTKQRIVRHLRSSSEPVLSAKKLAEQIDVSVRTINNHVGTLVEDERISTTQIGNATAYYIPFSDLPPHKKPDHICNRCGREVNEHHDFAKVDWETYFAGDRKEPSTADFYILCRFCYSDFVSWVESDPGFIGMYPSVHGWDIPSSQLIEVREDPDVATAPNTDTLSGDMETVLNLIVSLEEEYDNQDVPMDAVVDAAEDEGLDYYEVDSTLNNLKNAGYIKKSSWDRIKSAK